MRVRFSSYRLIGGLAFTLLLPLVAAGVPGTSFARQEISVETFTVADRRNDQLHPRISGKLVVWQDYRDIGAYTTDEGNADIYARNLDSDDEIKVTDQHTASHPDVSGDVIVYEDSRNGDLDIRGYDVVRDDAFWVVRRAGSDQKRPAVDGRIVVWQDNRDGTWDIRGKNLDTDEEFWVSHRDGNQMNPRISGRYVVWEDDRDGCCDIYVKNLQTGDVTRVTDSNDASQPDIDGEWIVYRREDGDRASIYAYNLASGDRVRLNSTREGPRQSPAVDGRLVVWSDKRNGDDFNIFGYDLVGRQEFAIVRANEDQLEPAVSGKRVVWTDERGDRGAQIRGAVLSLPDDTAPTPSPTPTTQPVAGPPCEPGASAPLLPWLHDARYFPQTGFRVDNDVIWDYFIHRGGVKNFGYPVSRTVLFMGLPTQFFQRQIVQIGPNGAAQLVNLLDPDMMPATTINFSTYPAVDPGVKAETPKVGEPGYATRIIDFTRSVAPDTWQGMPVRFFSTFMNQVTLQDAYPNGGGNPALLPLLNLELSGAPISRPQADPSNANFVYQRFQRVILHYDATSGLTQPILLADYFKDVLMGRAPADLMNQMAGSRFINQYNPSKPFALNRPEELPQTNLCGAFERQ